MSIKGTRVTWLELKVIRLLVIVLGIKHLRVEGGYGVVVSRQHVHLALSML